MNRLATAYRRHYFVEGAPAIGGPTVIDISKGARPVEVSRLAGRLYLVKLDRSTGGYRRCQEIGCPSHCLHCAHGIQRGISVRAGAHSRGDGGNAQGLRCRLDLIELDATQAIIMAFGFFRTVPPAARDRQPSAENCLGFRVREKRLRLLECPFGRGCPHGLRKSFR
jgi:hypothetical protein